MKLIIRKSFLSNIVVLIFFVLVLFTPDIRFLPKLTWVLAFAGGITLFDRPFVRKIGLYTIYSRNYVTLLIVSFVILSVQPFLHGTNDFSYIELLVGIILTMLRNFLLLYLLYYKRSSNMFDDYCKFFLQACCIYVGFTIVFIIFPEFKDFWMNSILASSIEQTFYKYKFRYSLSGFAAFMSSSMFSLAAVMSGYVISKDSNKNMLKVIQFIWITIGCFFYGRVAFIGVACGIVIIVFSKGNVLKTAKVILAIAGITFLLVMLVNYLATVDENFLVWKEWAFAFVKQIFVDKEITDYSVTHMFSDMYFMPEWDTFIFGDGFYVDKYSGGYYMSTDVGYMRLILYSGIIGMFFAFVPLLYMIRICMKKSSNRNDKLFFMLLLVVWLVLEAKGDMYHRTMMIVYPLFLSLVALKDENREGENSSLKQIGSS